MKFLCASLEFFPEGAGCRGEYTIETEAANLFGRIILATKFFPNTERLFSRLAGEAREYAAGRSSRKFLFKATPVAPLTQTRIQNLAAKINATHYAHGLAGKLCDYIIITGDAVMAAFSDPADGLRCAMRIQDDFAVYNATPGKEAAIITLGVHTDCCIAVTLNNRLDYYDTAANKAARLEGQSLGEDIVFSPEFAADPAVQEILSEISVTENLRT